MHPPRTFRCRTRLLFCLLAAGLQPLAGATLYWTAPGGGASPTWQEGSPHWSSDPDRTTSARWSNAHRDTAVFKSTADPTPVTVTETVSAGALHFHSGGHTLSQAPIRLGRTAGAGNITLLHYVFGTGDNTIANKLIVDDPGSVGTNVTYLFSNSAQGVLTLSGDVSIDYGDHTPAGAKSLHFQTGAAHATITLNGHLSPGAPDTAASRASLVFGQGGSSRAHADGLNGTFRINGGCSFARVAIHGGTVLVGTDNAFGTAIVSPGHSGSRGKIALLTEGARTLANPITISGGASSQTYIGGNTAHDTTFHGHFHLTGFGTTGTARSLGTLGNPNPIFTAVAGGKVNLTGHLTTTAEIPRGLVKQGAGIVSLNHPGGNTLKGLIAINEGTLLLMNTSGSATGDASQLAPRSAGVVIDAHARLGGTGIAANLVEAAAATSTLTPGDMTKEGVSSVGTLHLAGGLVAKRGVTFAFDVRGDAIDQVDLGAAPLELNGTVTLDFAATSAIRTGIAYRLLTGSGDWSATSANFVLNTPAGYLPDASYGDGKGYVFDASARSLTVRFESLPDPSTYTFHRETGAF